MAPLIAVEAPRAPQHAQRLDGARNHPSDNTIKLLTMHVSKGLEFPVLSGVGQMPMEGRKESEEARLFYVAATRATDRLSIPLSGQGRFGQRFGVGA